MKRVLVACEFSGILREAFKLKGWDAWSCDLLPTEIEGQHYECDIREILYSQHWDLLCAFPPCTYLCSSGLHWTRRGLRDPQLTEDALDFVRMLMTAPVQSILIENPVGCISTRIREPDCYIQPWQFGHPESKKTCLWLKNLPILQATNKLCFSKSGRWENQTASGQNKLTPSANRGKERSRTYPGVAAAIADQFTNPREERQMTIKEIDCAGCGGTGFFLRASTKILSWEPINFEKDIENDFEVEKCFCNCLNGQIEQVLQNRRSRPQHEDPLGHLSDNQVIELLSQSESTH